MPVADARASDTMIEAIFFDFNGVIINDERIHLKAYREVLKENGIELTEEDYFASLGMDDVAFVRAAYARATREVDDATMHDLIDREHALHRQLIENELPMAAGVIAFIKQCSRRYEIGIVSMAERSEIDHVLTLAAITDAFDIIVSAEPSLDHKPAPDCYLRAMEVLNDHRRGERKLPILANECVVIEDSPPGIESARAAGMHTIGVTTTVNETALRAAGAEIVTPNLSDWDAGAIHYLFD